MYDLDHNINYYESSVTTISMTKLLYTVIMVFSHLAIVTSVVLYVSPRSYLFPYIKCTFTLLGLLSCCMIFV